MTTLAPAAHRPAVLADTLIPRPTSTAAAWVHTGALIVAGATFTALLARVEVPMWPVPITGQTLAVLLVGATLGARRGGAAMVTYLLAGLAGLPVFAGGTGSLAAIATPSFGYIIGFIPAAALIGYLAEHHWDRRPLLATAGFGLATILPFVFGVPYMGFVLGQTGIPVSFALLMKYGVTPFLLGGAIKCASAAVSLPLAWRLVGHPRSKK
ncbi:MAG: biotin transporter BioY [Bowdeniella nasicola]|nr:biotin transporter BioY [Bowdeniella nasicola]